MIEETTIRSLPVEALRHEDLHAGHDDHALFQASTVSALLDGAYDGDLTFAELAAEGDTGIGTLNGLDGEMIASHVPVLLDGDAAAGGRLIGHVARANPHWRDIGGGIEALAIFQGPHAYVSASWYASRRVPTWNYIAVHVHGRARILDGPEEILEVLARTVAHQEADRPRPWRIEDQPKEYIRGMAKGVVALELEVGRIEGKAKLSQNVARADQEGAIAGLVAEGDALSLATAAAMRRACGLEEPD